MAGLRCKPGDVAVIVVPFEHADNGRFVNVGVAAPVHTARYGVACWWIESLDRRPLCTNSGPSATCAMADMFLQPIRGQQQPEAIFETAPDVAHAEA